MGKVYTQIPFDGVIHFDDVVATLAANGGTGMTSADGASLFTTEANIRWDAKYKPIDLAEHFPDRTADWWKGKDGFCGLNLDNARRAGDAYQAFKYFTGAEDGIVRIDGKMNGWEYVLPKGGASSPYRIEDFEGYAPQDRWIGAYSVPSKFGTSLTVALRQTVYPEKTLTFADFDNAWADLDTRLSEFYFGAIMVRNGTENFIARTSEQDLTQSTSVTINTETVAEGSTWTVMPFIFSKTIPEPVNGKDEQDKVGVFFTIPNTSLATITRSKTTPSIRVTATKIPPVKIAVTVAITNSTESSMWFRTNTVWLALPDSSLVQEGENEKRLMLEDFEVEAGETYNAELTFDFLNIITYNNGLVTVLLNAGAYKFGPFMPIETV